MRPGQHQQNRRGRGRNNNGPGNNGGNNSSNVIRKGQNPLTRSFESNGPDVKVRGTPAHIAEKYLALARDAQSSGDRVLAENYLQHAEHYNRIIMAYREQFQPPGEQQGPTSRRMSGTDGFDLPGEFGDEDGSDGDTTGDDIGGGPQPAAQPTQPHAGQDFAGGQNAPQQRQPYRNDRPEQHGQQGRYDRNANQGNGGDGQPRGDRPFRRDGQNGQNGQRDYPNNRFRDRNDRNNRPYGGPGNGPNQGHGDRDRPQEPRFERGERSEQRPDPRGDNRPAENRYAENRYPENRQDRGPDPRNQDQRPQDQRPPENRPQENRPQDARGERSPRPDRQQHAERPELNNGTESAQPQPAFTPVQPSFEPQPAAVAPTAPSVDVTALPAFVAAPPHLTSAIPVPVVAPARRRERAVEQPGADAPEFLRRPVRRARPAVAVTTPDADVPPAGTPPADDNT